jgi:hypothetical protein
MTLQEKTMLSDFLGKLVSANNINKDAEADAMIKQAMVAQPDAGYMLVQNILLMQHTFNEMNNKIQELESCLNSQSTSQNSSSSFLGPQSQNAVKSYFAHQSPQPSQPQLQPQPQQYGNGAQQQQAGQSSGFGEFLKSAGTTAAGVAGGMFLFEGVSSLFGGHHGGGFGGVDSASMGGNTNIVNNYYGDSNQDSGASGDFLDSNDIDNSFDGGFGGDSSDDVF